MATDRKAITVYLPDNLVKYITQYCTSNEIVGKNKNGEVVPRLATGIVELLKIVSATPVDELSSNNAIPSSEIENIKKHLARIEDKLNLLENKTSKVSDRVLDLENTSTVLNKELINKRTGKTTLPEEPEEVEVKLTSTGKTENKPVTDDSRKVKSKKEAIARLKTLPREMTGKVLEELIKMTSTYASKYKKNPQETKFDPWRNILELLQMPKNPRDKWINPYGQ